MDTDFDYENSHEFDTISCRNIMLRTSEDKTVAILCTDENDNAQLVLMDSDGKPGHLFQTAGTPRYSIVSKTGKEMLGITGADEIGGVIIVHKDGNPQRVLSSEGVQDAEQIKS